MIKYENVSLEFEGKKILKDFNLTVSEHEKVLLYGKSGIGKSTVLKLLLGFIKPDAGKIYFRNMMLDKDSVWEVRKDISYVSQNTDIGEGSIQNLVDYAFNFKANKDKLSEKKYDELLEYFHLSKEIKHKNIEHLSGGEKQRIAIIISILLNRNIYLLDEVTSGLDSKLKHKVIEYFTGNDKLTTLIISHDESWFKADNIRVVNMESEVL